MLTGNIEDVNIHISVYGCPGREHYVIADIRGVTLLYSVVGGTFLVLNVWFQRGRQAFRTEEGCLLARCADRSPSFSPLQEHACKPSSACSKTWRLSEHRSAAGVTGAASAAHLLMKLSSPHACISLYLLTSPGSSSSLLLFSSHAVFCSLCLYGEHARLPAYYTLPLPVSTCGSFSLPGLALAGRILALRDMTAVLADGSGRSGVACCRSLRGTCTVSADGATAADSTAWRFSLSTCRQPFTSPCMRCLAFGARKHR